MVKIFRERSHRCFGVLLLLGLYILALLLVDFGARQESYQLRVNDVSDLDIVAPRSLIDKAATQRRAEEARNQVPRQMERSQPLSDQALQRLQTFLSILTELRTVPEGEDPALHLDERLDAAMEASQSKLRAQISRKDYQSIAEMSADHFILFQDRLQGLASSVMSGLITDADLSTKSESVLHQLFVSETVYLSDRSILSDVLQACLIPNAIFNERATRNAQADAYQRVMDNPILINRGARIVTAGEIINEETYAMLRDLGLIDNSRWDLRTILLHTAEVTLIFIALLLYLHFVHPELLYLRRSSLALALAMLLPLAVSAYLAPYNVQVPPVVFAAVVLAAYFGFDLAFVFSLGLIGLVLPMVQFNASFFMTALLVSLVAALIATQSGHQDNMAKLILWTALAAFLASMTFDYLQNPTLVTVPMNVIVAVASAVLSVIAAIGLMPFFEWLMNAVSPMRLMSFAQPDHPILQRLFLEAPGTLQHSMMVATLADAAASAVGANALICRVGSYYHDIGKLQNPQYFVENQHGVNPHDQLSPQESAAIILRHPEDGLRLGRKIRLPEPVLHIIHEHHGTTLLAYFYGKAKMEAEARGEGLPDETAFRYQTPLPSSREAAIVMLADSSEAAVKSLKNPSPEEIRAMLRKVFHTKIEQDQLEHSGLGFADLSRVIEAFTQVFQGHFHERIAYPGEKSAN